MASRRKMQLKLSIIVDLSVVTVFPSLSFPNCLCSFPNGLTSLKSCISQGYSMLMQNATGCFCAGQGQVKSGVNQGLYLFLVYIF